MNQNKSRDKGFLRFAISAFFASVLALAFVSSASAQWRWVDENGSIHMSDTAPPSSVPNDKILSRPDSNRPNVQQRGTRIVGGAENSKPATTSANDRKLEEEQARIAAEQAKAEEERKQEDNRRREQACENAKKRGQLYGSGERIRNIDSKGEYYYLSDQEIAENKKKAQEDQKAYCTQP